MMPDNRVKRLSRYTSLILFFVATGIAAQNEGTLATPMEQYQALLKEFQGNAAYFQSTNERERQEIVGRIAKATERLLDLVEENPKESFALAALTQVITEEYWLNMYTSHPGWGKESRQVRAIALLLRDHLDNDKLGETCKRVSFGFRQEGETFLRPVLAKSPHREVRGEACLRLAQFLASQVEKVDLMKEQPELARR